jgi:hypothetical protein
MLLELKNMLFDSLYVRMVAFIRLPTSNFSLFLEFYSSFSIR